MGGEGERISITLLLGNVKACQTLDASGSSTAVDPGGDVEETFLSKDTKPHPDPGPLARHLPVQ